MLKARFLTIILILTLWFSNSVPTALAAPNFGKISPENGATNVPGTSVKLSWQAVQEYTSAVTYRYCLQTKTKCPPGKWVRVGSSTSIIVKNLKPNTKYYWWVRAYDSQNTLVAEADGGSWNFTTQALPGSFNKLSPVNDTSDVLTTGAQLSWGNSANPAPDHYEYCLDTVSNNRCDTQWITATSPVTLTNLSLNSVYYWQVRAVNGSGYTLANNGSWWAFTTLKSSSVFDKLWPPDAAVNQPATGLGLSWMISPNVIRYQYCVSTTNNACTPLNWIDAGTATSATYPNQLNYATQYYWQVQAVYSNDTTPANGGTWWRLTTQDAPPAAFEKLTPVTNDTNLYTDVTFTWQPSAGASYYEVCLSDTNNDITCGDTPWDIVNGTSYTVYGLDVDFTYYWQVRAVNGTATTESNTGTWWTFQTQPDPPVAFNKTSPADGATGTASNLNLAWDPTTSTGVTYQVCYDTTNDAICDSNAWLSVPSGTSYNLPNLASGIRYYWQVRATNGGGTTYANGDAARWWSFTTLPDAPVSSDLTIYDIPEDQTISNAVLGADTAGWVFTRYGAAPAGTLDFQATGHFTYTPVENANGPVTFQFRVSDSVNPIAGPYTVTLNYVPVNDPPDLGTGGGAIIFPSILPSGIPWSMTLIATDVDTPANQLTFSATNLPTGASIVSTTGVFSWTPIYIKGGTNTHTFTISVSDGALSDSQSVTITVVQQRMFLPFTTRQ